MTFENLLTEQGLPLPPGNNKNTMCPSFIFIYAAFLPTWSSGPLVVWCLLLLWGVCLAFCEWCVVAFGFVSGVLADGCGGVRTVVMVYHGWGRKGI